MQTLTAPKNTIIAIHTYDNGYGKEEERIINVTGLHADIIVDRLDDIITELQLGDTYPDPAKIKEFLTTHWEAPQVPIHVVTATKDGHVYNGYMVTLETLPAYFRQRQSQIASDIRASIEQNQERISQGDSDKILVESVQRLTRSLQYIMRRLNLDMNPPDPVDITETRIRVNAERILAEKHPTLKNALNKANADARAFQFSGWILKDVKYLIKQRYGKPEPDTRQLTFDTHPNAPQQGLCHANLALLTHFFTHDPKIYHRLKQPHNL